MTQESKDRIIKELTDLRDKAMQEAVSHENEATRYRKQFHALDLAITSIIIEFYGKKIVAKISHKQ